MADIIIIDAGLGNLQSVKNAFDHVGLKTEISRDLKKVASADAIVLPGVGAFENAVHNLNSLDLVPLLNSHVESKRPMLGICLGMQLLAEQSTEFGLHNGLGYISGRVIRLSPVECSARVPNIGWQEVNLKNVNDRSLFSSDSNDRFFYHVHSYHMQCDNDSDVAATINYGGQEVVVAVQRENVYGVQFHPEKSQNSGLDLIERFGQLL